MDAFVAQGDRHFVDEEYEEALVQYAKAVKENPNNPQAYEARAKTHIKLKQFTDAIEDASKAIELDPKFAKAYLQKGIALFHEEEYESANEAFEAGAALAPSNNQFKTWLRKCQAELDEEASAAPSAPAPSQSKPAPPPAATPSAAPPAVPSSTPAAAPAPAPTPAPAASASISAATGGLAPAAAPAFQGKYRFQHYQIQDKVVVDVYAKNLKAEQVVCTIQEQHLTCVINDLEGQEEYKLDVPLYAKVVPGGSRYEVLRSKVEISMKKADNTAWPSLEPSSKVAAPNYSSPDFANPKYPSSYKKNPKDWDKFETEIKDMEKEGELEDGDPLNNFFKKLYKDADDDTRRAMIKSFTESNGTALSTNWKEVGTKPTDFTPPEGVEVKKFEY